MEDLRLFRNARGMLWLSTVTALKNHTVWKLTLGDSRRHLRWYCDTHHYGGIVSYLKDSTMTMHDLTENERGWVVKWLLS